MENGTAVKEEGKTDAITKDEDKVKGEVKMKVSWLSSFSAIILHSFLFNSDFNQSNLR